MTALTSRLSLVTRQNALWARQFSGHARVEAGPMPLAQVFESVLTLVLLSVALVANGSMAAEAIGLFLRHAATGHTVLALQALLIAAIVSTFGFLTVTVLVARAAHVRFLQPAEQPDPLAALFARR